MSPILSERWSRRLRCLLGLTPPAMRAQPWVRRVQAAESGQAVVWLAVMLPFFVSIVGLCLDGGNTFNARLRLQQVASGAARAGATQIDERVYRESGGATLVLDAARARRVAADYLIQSGLALTGTVDVGPRRVVVDVSEEWPTVFVRIVGLNVVHVRGSAAAELRFGVERGAR